MTAYCLPALFVLLVWWVSTGAVLAVVSLPARGEAGRIVAAGALLVASLFGLAISADDVGLGGAYVAFSAAIALWGAQEIAFLSDWITGPRAAPCPPGCVGAARLRYAVMAILYHELFLVACMGAALALTWNEPNKIGLWAFVALWALRLSAKVNLFVGVRTHNDEMLPARVAYLKSYFSHRPGNRLLPLSLAAALAAAAWLIASTFAPDVSDAAAAGLTMVATLILLGALEHGFMMLPMSVAGLWRWGMASREAGGRGGSTRRGSYKNDHKRRAVTDGASLRGGLCADAAPSTQGRTS